MTPVTQQHIDKFLRVLHRWPKLSVKVFEAAFPLDPLAGGKLMCVIELSRLRGYSKRLKPYYGFSRYALTELGKLRVKEIT